MIDPLNLIPDEQSEDNGVQKGWTAIWELAARYHRYEVEGLQHVMQDPDNRKTSLIVGYHGRPLAVDLCILSVRLRQMLGYFPHCFMHRHVRSLPGGEHIIESLGFLTHDGEPIEQAKAKGEHILVPPGGASEGMRRYRDNYQVRWPSSGYARLAVRHRLDIIPVACAQELTKLISDCSTVKRLSSAWVPTRSGRGRPGPVLDRLVYIRFRRPFQRNSIK